MSNCHIPSEDRRPVGIDQSFADIVSKEIQNQWTKKKTLIRRSEQNTKKKEFSDSFQPELQPSYLDFDRYYACGIGDETGRHSQKFSALNKHESTWRLSPTRIGNSNSNARASPPSISSVSTKSSTPSSPAAPWNASQYGYSDSENADDFEKIKSPTPPPAFQSIERALEKRQHLRSTVPFVLPQCHIERNNKPASNAREGRLLTKKKKKRQLSGDQLIDASFNNNEGDWKCNHFRSHTVGPSFLNRKVSFGKNTFNEMIHTREREKMTNSSDDSESVNDDAKICELVKENLLLHQEVEMLEQKIETSEEGKKQERIKLLDTMAEKHQRRVRLLKEEFDYCLDTEKEKMEKERAKMIEQESRMSQRIKELEQHVNELEISERLAQEKSRHEERRVETETKQIAALKEQISASLSTVSQFSEKNLELMREIELLKSGMDKKEQLEKSLSELQQKLQLLKVEHSELTEKLREKGEEVKSYNNQIKHKDQELTRMSEIIQKTNELLKTEQTSKEALQSTCSELELRITVLASEAEVLRQRHDECLEVARSAWEEVTTVKQEASILRQQLSQQDLTIDRLKQFARGHQRTFSPSRITTEEPSHNRENETDFNEKINDMATKRLNDSSSKELSRSAMKSSMQPYMSTLTKSQDFCAYAPECHMSKPTEERESKENVPDQSQSSVRNREQIFQKLPPHVLAWFNKATSPPPKSLQRNQTTTDPFTTIDPPSTNFYTPPVANSSQFITEKLSLPILVKRTVDSHREYDSRAHQPPNILPHKTSTEVPMRVAQLYQSEMCDHYADRQASLRACQTPSSDATRVSDCRITATSIEVERDNRKTNREGIPNEGLGMNQNGSLSCSPKALSAQSGRYSQTKISPSDFVNNTAEMTPTTVAPSPVAGFDTTASSISLLNDSEFPVDWSQFASKGELSDISQEVLDNYDYNCTNNSSMIAKLRSAAPKPLSSLHESQSALSGDERSNKCKNSPFSSETSSPCSFEKTSSTSTTRLVKVMTESGRCRYELQSISTT